MATAKHPPARPRALGPDGEWAQPPPLNVVAFLGAGMYLRDAQRRAQREERDADADAELPQPRPLALSPPERPTPPAETRANDASARDDAGEPSTSVSSSSAAAVCRLVSGGSEFSDALRAPARVVSVSARRTRSGSWTRGGARRGRRWTDAWCHRVVVPGRRSGSTSDACGSGNESASAAAARFRKNAWCAIRSSARRAPRWRTFYRSGSARAPPTASPDTSARGGRCSPTPSWRKRGPRTSSPRISSRVSSSPSSFAYGAGARFEAETVSSAAAKTREVVHQRALRRSHHVAGQSRRRLGRGCARAPRRSHGSDHTRT